MLNPELDFDQLAAEYSADKRGRVANVLKNDVAERLQALLNKLPYDLAYVIGDQNLSISLERLSELSPDERRQLFSAIYSEASRGVGFLYGRFHLNAANDTANNKDYEFLHEVNSFLNSAEMFSAIQKITGIDDIQSADAQATSYRAGHFLTRHRDDLSGQERRLAYVFGFSQTWHPDWGGLLQFFEDDGTPRDAWAPQFNTLSLFDVSQALSWVATARRNPEERVAWQSSIPTLIGKIQVVA